METSVRGTALPGHIHGDYECSGLLWDGDPAARDQSSRCGLHRMPGNGKDVKILANAALYLRVASPFYAVLGILYNMRNGLQAMGEKRKPLTSSFMELVGKIVFSACIIPVLGYWGVIICEPMIWCCMTAQLVYCYVHVMRDNLQKVGMET